jgi:phosphoribosylaminoimidazole-succinocarboxamide synthase
MSPQWEGDALISPGELEGLKLLATGKVRDIYDVDAQSLLIVSSDRISAFDVIMLNGVAGKGKILTQLTTFWLAHLEGLGIISHHLITADVDAMPAPIKAHSSLLRGRSMLVKKLKMLPVEAVVRGYIAGSGWGDYLRTGMICGHSLPKGIELSQKLPHPLFTPSTKADLGEHDENITASQAAAVIGAELAKRVEDLSIALYDAVAEYSAPRGILLADTKMEFGQDSSGELILGDECFTPDCSRYWPSEGYATGREQNSFDKQFVRNYLTSIAFDKKTPLRLPDDVVQKTMEKYVQIFRILTGKEPEL